MSCPSADDIRSGEVVQVDPETGPRDLRACYGFVMEVLHLETEDRLRLHFPVAGGSGSVTRLLSEFVVRRVGETVWPVSG